MVANLSGLPKNTARRRSSHPGKPFSRQPRKKSGYRPRRAGMPVHPLRWAIAPGDLESSHGRGTGKMESAPAPRSRTLEKYRSRAETCERPRYGFIADRERGTGIVSAIIHHRRTVAANAVDRIRQASEIKRVKRSTEVSDMTKPLRELKGQRRRLYAPYARFTHPQYEKQSEVLQEWFDGTGRLPPSNGFFVKSSRPYHESRKRLRNPLYLWTDG